MTSTINQTGVAFDYNISTNETILKNYAASNEAVTVTIGGVTESVHKIATSSEETRQLSEDLKNTIAYFN